MDGGTVAAGSSAAAYEELMLMIGDNCEEDDLDDWDEDEDDEEDDEDEEEDEGREDDKEKYRVHDDIQTSNRNGSSLHKRERDENGNLHVDDECVETLNPKKQKHCHQLQNSTGELEDIFREPCIRHAKWICRTPAPTESGSSVEESLHEVAFKDPGVMVPVRNMKRRLVKRWTRITDDGRDHNDMERNIDIESSDQHIRFETELQSRLYRIFTTHRDVLLPIRPLPKVISPEDPKENGADSICDAYLLHCLNHVLTSMDAKKKNNDRKKNMENVSVDDKNTVEEIDESLMRDQGFTRAKCLILLPMRNSAARVVGRMAQMCPSVENVDQMLRLHRFIRDYCLHDEKDEDVNNSKRTRRPYKPQEHKNIFDGNCDDHFILGVKLTRGSMQLFVDPIDADIIVASPIGIITEMAKDPGKTNDFLTSIEILVLEHVDILSMQNWSHVQTVVENLNRMPHDQRDADFTRVKEYFLNGEARKYRQTILLSAVLDPQIVAMFSRQFENMKGNAMLSLQYPGVQHCITKKRVKQLYKRLDVERIEDEPDIRFEYFIENFSQRLKVRIIPSLGREACPNKQFLWRTLTIHKCHKR